MEPDFFNLSDEERQNYSKVMNMIFRRDSKGNYLVEDLVRENQSWETNDRCMRSIFNLVSTAHNRPVKQPDSTFGAKRNFDHVRN